METAESLRQQRDALFSLFCKQGKDGRWHPLVVVGTKEEALAFNGFSGREEAMETLVKWASEPVAPHEPDPSPEERLSERAKASGWEMAGWKKTSESLFPRIRIAP